MYPVTESFSWLVNDPLDLQKSTDGKAVKIKGVATPKNAISLNNRAYLADEMHAAARTFIDVPITINHADWSNKKNRKGQVEWMEYDPADGNMEYVAKVWDPEIVTELRLYKENPAASRVRGVSIEADYLHLVCPKCGEKFITQEEWADHMATVEHVKDAVQVPHGIRGRALSLVLAPEVAGVPGNTLEVIETKQNGFLRLIETVIKSKTVKENEKHIMKKQSKEGKQTGPAYIETPPLQLIEQEEPEKDEHGCVIGKEKWDGENCVPIEKPPEATEQEEAPSPPCPEGWHEVDGKCVKDELTEPEQATEQEGEPCPEGQQRDPTTGECVPNVDDTVTEQEDDVKPGSHYCEEHPDDPRCIEHKKAIHGEEQEHQCPDGEHWSEEEQKCVPNVTEQEEQEPPAPATHECPSGQHWDDTQSACVVDEEVPSQVTTELLATKLKPFSVKESAPKLKLGEPFAGYSSFEDCVSKNQDKENPEAYCGQIKHQVEGEIWWKRNIADKVNELVGALNSLEVLKPDKSWVPRLAVVEKKFSNVAEWATVKPLIAELAISKQKYASLVEALKKLPADDRSWKPKLIAYEKRVKALEASEVKATALLTDKVKELYGQIKTVKETILSQKEELEEQITTLNTGFAKIKEAYEADLAAYKKDLKEYWEPLKTKQETQEKELDEVKNKLTETTTELEKTKTIAETAKTKSENLEDKQKGTFQAKAKEVTQQAEVSTVNHYADAG